MDDLQPIAYKVKTVELGRLSPGYRGPNCHFDFKSYEDRDRREQEDMDRLRKSILERGIVTPLIVYQNHVLIGMRRWEIGVRVDIHSCTVWEIVGEDPGDWLSPDINRLNDLKRRCGDCSY